MMKKSNFIFSHKSLSTNFTVIGIFFTIEIRVQIIRIKLIKQIRHFTPRTILTNDQSKLNFMLRNLLWKFFF